MTDEAVKVGLMGSGSAGHLYLRQGRSDCSLRYVACADVDRERARALAEEYGLPRGCTPEELLADPDVDVIVNLTPAPDHGRVGLQIVQSGHHLFSEKPLAPTVREGRRLLAAAVRYGVRVGCAPDTFLGPAFQTARRVLDSGRLGTPFGAAVALAVIPPETWHPRPAHLYGEAAGPLFDMGPYYLTALVTLLGPVARVTGFATSAPRDRRTLSGEAFTPTVPSHEVGSLEFACGAVAGIAFSFDAARTAAPPIEVHATDGSLRLPDPNRGFGQVSWCRVGEREWTDEPDAGVGGQSRCIGIEDLVAGVREGRPHRASGELALHVLDVMESLRRAAATGRVVRLTTTCERPAPLGDGTLSA